MKRGRIGSIAAESLVECALPPTGEDYRRLRHGALIGALGAMTVELLTGRISRNSPRKNVTLAVAGAFLGIAYVVSEIGQDKSSSCDNEPRFQDPESHPTLPRCVP